ncbi:hypothetical protein BC835DRAFT_827526 [Cytidiella melzeri]|nr:hypothetical protein BC835DRAFT_827526 [Cytidiella melzeri]
MAATNHTCTITILLWLCPLTRSIFVGKWAKNSLTTPRPLVVQRCRQPWRLGDGGRTFLMPSTHQRGAFWWQRRPCRDISCCRRRVSRHPAIMFVAPALIILVNSHQ